VRVLFVHGLESGPKGSKVARLHEQGFTVVCPDMGMSLLKLDKPNSVARNVLRHWLVWVGGVGVAGFAASSVFGAGWVSVAGAAGVLVAVRLQWARIVRDAMRRSLESCVAVQERALADEAPDAIVGSSWGGAVTLELLRRGAWTGPTVLLAPAWGKVLRTAAPTEIDGRLRELRVVAEKVPIRLVHDTSDDAVPHRDSVDLAAATGIELDSVDGGGHRLMGFVDGGRLAEVLRGLS